MRDLSAVLPLNRLQSWLRDHPQLADGALAALVWLIDVGQLRAGFDVLAGGGLPALLVVVSTLQYVALAWRRAAPVLIFSIMVVHVVPATVLVPDYRVIGVLVALYTVSAYRRRVIGVAALATAVAVLTTTGVVDQLSRPSTPGQTFSGVLTTYLALNGAMAVVVWGFGRFARTTRLAAGYQRELAELQRREAIRSERTAIAHELHDVVAHAVVMMMLQTSAARLQLPGEPELAKATLKDVEESGARAMEELRAMLGVLRSVEDAGGPVAADVTLAGLVPVVESARRAGLEVRECHTGEAQRLEPSTDLAAVRIVQEALTNAIKHAGPGTGVTVDIAWVDVALELRIVDDGRGQPVFTPAHVSAGVGLTGLRERAASVGGRLRAGGTAEGGFEVVAELPVPGPGRSGEVADKPRVDTQVVRG